MKDLTEGKEGKLIWRFAMPMIIGSVFQQLYSIVDSVVVGKFIGKDALAAVGDSFPILFAIISLAMGLGMGGAIVLGQFFGAKEFAKVKKTADTLIITMFFASILAGIGGYFGAEAIFRLMRLPEDLIPPAVDYMQVLMLGMPAMFGYNTVSAILRGLGDSKNPLYFLIISNVVNAILAVVFVLGLNMGIKGAALATVIANLISWIISIIFINKKHAILKFHILNIEFDKDIFVKSFKIGLPAGLQQLFVALGMGALMGIVNTFGVNVIAAYTAAGRIDALAALPAMNFSIALSSFVAQNIGAGKFDRVKRGLYATLKMSIVVSVVTSLFVGFFGDSIMHIFIDKSQAGFEDVVRIGHEYLIIVCSFYVLFSTMFVLGGLMRGAGAVIVPMFVTLLSLWLIRVPLAFILSGSMGVHGIWWSIPIGWIAGTIGSYLYYISGKWKNKAVVKTVPVTEDEAIS